MPAKNETLIQDVDPNFAVVPAGTLIPEMVPLHNRLISYKEFLPGESLTSWLLRLSHANRVPVVSIKRLLGISTLISDLDIRATNKQWINIQEFLKTDVEKRCSFDARLIRPEFNQEPFIKYFTKDHQGSVHRFCPACLAADTPYFRAKWRLNFYVMCEQHHSIMLNACTCGHIQRPEYAPDDFLVRTPDAFCYCASCQRDIRKQEPIPFPHDHAWRWHQNRQRRLWKIIQYGFEQVGKSDAARAVSGKEAISRCLKKDKGQSAPRIPLEFSYERVFDGAIADLFGDRS